jgi:DNA-binding transcriptional LysR family regulator
MLDLMQLTSFCAVVDTQSFTKAGKKVHRTQSTISAQIAHLEEMYGGELLERLSDGVVPTQTGRLLYDYAKRIIALADESIERITELEHTVLGELVVGASTIPGTYILPRLISNFTKDFPDVVVSIQVSNSRTVLNNILNKTVEVGAVGQKISNPRIEYITLATDSIDLIVPPKHPWTKKKSVTLDQVVKEPFISREEGSGTWAAVQAVLKKKGIKHLNTKVSVGSTEAVKQSVKAGLGVSFVSEWALKGSPLPTVAIKGVSVTRKFYLASFKAKSRKRIVDAFIKSIRS